MAQKEIKTSILIKATPEKVWNILTDFENYASWNPFIKSIKGEVAVGKTIDVAIEGMQFKPKVLVFEKNKELRWLGKLLLPGIFDGEHLFQIEDHKNGSITFHHNEKFKGILVGLFSKKLDKDPRQGFIKMNEKLKALAEQ